MRYEIFPLLLHEDGTPKEWGIGGVDADGSRVPINIRAVYTSAEAASRALYHHLHPQGGHVYIIVEHNDGWAIRDLPRDEDRAVAGIGGQYDTPIAAVAALFQFLTGTGDPIGGYARYESVAQALATVNDLGKLRITLHKRNGECERAEAYTVLHNPHTDVWHLHAGKRRSINDNFPRENERGEILWIQDHADHKLVYTVHGELRDLSADLPQSRYFSHAFTVRDEAEALDLYREQFPQYRATLTVLGDARIRPVPAE